MRKLLVIAATLIVATAIVSSWVHLNRPDGQQSSPLKSRRGTPLAELVKNHRKDVPVVIEKDQQPPHQIEPPPGTRPLEWMTSRAPLVLVIRVDELAPEFTPEQDWINTRVKATVLAVLKKPVSDGISPEGLVEFTQDGGALVIDGTQVRAELPWATALNIGQRYLVFAERLNATSEIQINLPASYLISTGERLRAVAKQGKALTESDVSLADASNRIRAVKEGK